jgi:hypothetical protein
MRDSCISKGLALLQSSLYPRIMQSLADYGAQRQERGKKWQRLGEKSPGSPNPWQPRPLAELPLLWTRSPPSPPPFLVAWTGLSAYPRRFVLHDWSVGCWTTNTGTQETMEGNVFAHVFAPVLQMFLGVPTGLFAYHHRLCVLILKLLLYTSNIQ